MTEILGEVREGNPPGTGSPPRKAESAQRARSITPASSVALDAVTQSARAAWRVTMATVTAADRAGSLADAQPPTFRQARAWHHQLRRPLPGPHPPLAPPAVGLRPPAARHARAEDRRMGHRIPHPPRRRRSPSPPPSGSGGNPDDTDRPRARRAAAGVLRPVLLAGDLREDPRHLRVPRRRRGRLRRRTRAPAHPGHVRPGRTPGGRSPPGCSAGPSPGCCSSPPR